MARRRSNRRWIQGLKKGTFTRKAKAAGMTVAGYARKVLRKNSRASTKTKRQAVAYRTLRRLARRRRRR